MKKALLFFAFLGFSWANAQFTVTPNPFGINSGTITISYGASGDYSLYDPNLQTTLYLYTGLDTDAVPSTWDYHDEWNDYTSLVPLTWNASENAYIATVNIGTRIYTEGISGTPMTIPLGTYVNNWYFLIRNFDGSTQSIDLHGTDYGFVPGLFLLSNAEFSASKPRFSISNGTFTTAVAGKSTLDIYSVSGQKVKTVSFDNNSGTFETPLHLDSKAVFIAILKNNGQTNTLKFVN